MTKPDLRHASASAVAESLAPRTDLSIADLCAALANAMERIASLEKDRDEVIQAWEAIDEQVKAARLHGLGLLNEQ